MTPDIRVRIGALVVDGDAKDARMLTAPVLAAALCGAPGQPELAVRIAAAVLDHVRARGERP